MKITIDDFKKIDLRVAKIIEAEKVEKSEKLIKLKVDLGEDYQEEGFEKERQILAGIGKFYNPDDLINRKIIIVANLEPKKMMGLESQGMLLAASIDGEPVLLKPERDIPAGIKIF